MNQTFSTPSHHYRRTDYMAKPKSDSACDIAFADRVMLSYP